MVGVKVLEELSSDGTQSVVGVTERFVELGHRQAVIA